MLEAQDDAFDNIIEHKITSIGHLNQLIKKLDLAPVRVLKHEFNVQIFVLKASKVLPAVLQVEPNEFETRWVDVNIAFDSFFELVLAFIQKIDNHFQQVHFPVHVLSELGKLAGITVGILEVAKVKLLHQLVQLLFNILNLLLVAFRAHKGLNLSIQFFLQVFGSTVEIWSPVTIDDNLLLQPKQKYAISLIHEFEQIASSNKYLNATELNALSNKLGQILKLLFLYLGVEESKLFGKN